MTQWYLDGTADGSLGVWSDADCQDGDLVCVIPAGENDSAYGRLIAAAPDLRQSLRELLDVVREAEPVVLGESDMAHRHRVVRAEAIKALARAEN
jgi:hypothetical protein